MFVAKIGHFQNGSNFAQKVRLTLWVFSQNGPFSEWVNFCSKVRSTFWVFSPKLLFSEGVNLLPKSKVNTLGFLPKLAKSRDYSSPMNKQLCPRAGDIHASEL